MGRAEDIDWGRTYSAFVSYSRKDGAFARWLHGRLESFSFPAYDGRKLTGGGKHPLRPAFRDIDELAASGDLGESIRSALTASNAVVLICSPDSARSHWVNREVEHFISLGRGDKILPVLLSGDPVHADEGASDRAAFPPALRGLTAEPFWVDARPGAESRDRVFARIAAGLMNVSFDQVWRRRRREMVARAAATTVGGLIVAIPLAAFAWDFSQPIQMSACPLDAITFQDAWLRNSGDAQTMRVRRVGLLEWQNCEDGMAAWTGQPSNDTCRGPYGDVVLSGDFTPEGGGRPMQDVYFAYHTEPGAPCCYWNVLDEATVQEITADETFRWLKPGEAPPLRALPVNEIKTDMYSNITVQVFTDNKTMSATSCNVTFAGRFGMFARRVAALFEPRGFPAEPGYGNVEPGSIDTDEDMVVDEEIVPDDAPAEAAPNDESIYRELTADPETPQ